MKETVQLELKNAGFLDDACITYYKTHINGGFLLSFSEVQGGGGPDRQQMIQKLQHCGAILVVLVVLGFFYKLVADNTIDPTICDSIVYRTFGRFMRSQLQSEYCKCYRFVRKYLEEKVAKPIESARSVQNAIGAVTTISATVIVPTLSAVIVAFKVYTETVNSTSKMLDEFISKFEIQDEGQRIIGQGGNATAKRKSASPRSKTTPPKSKSR
jgi:hypothetical protein